MKVRIRWVQPSDISQIARIHIHELSNGALCTIGEASMRALYHALNNEGNIILVAAEENVVLGYVTIAIKSTPLIKMINFQGWLSVFYGVLRRPKLAVTLVQTLIFSSETQKAISAYAGSVPVLELSHFAVNGPYKSRGIGGKLVSQVEGVAISTGAIYIYTTTDNRRLSDFYIRNYSAKIINKKMIGRALHQCLVWPSK